MITAVGLGPEPRPAQSRELGVVQGMCRCWPFQSMLMTDAERQEGLLDITALLRPLPFRQGLAQPLTPGEVQLGD